MDYTRPVKVTVPIYLLKRGGRSILFFPVLDRLIRLHDQVLILAYLVILSAPLVLLVGLSCGLFVPALHEIAFHTCVVGAM